MSEFIRTQQEARANLTMQIREVLESAESEGRGLDVAGSEKIDRIEADIRRADAAIEVATRNAQRVTEAEEASRGFAPVSAESRSSEDILRSIGRGETRSHEFERRTTLVHLLTLSLSHFMMACLMLPVWLARCLRLENVSTLRLVKTLQFLH